jgi:hypothetical protein
MQIKKWKKESNRMETKVTMEEDASEISRVKRNQWDDVYK